MSSGGRHGAPAEELFLQRPKPDSPTVEPLRINKHSPETAQRPSFADSPVFPLPPGASSSPAPLPYPDDRSPPQQRPSYGRNDSSTGRGSPQYPAPSSGRSGAAADPSKSKNAAIPSALKPREGRDGSSGSTTIAERRGNAPPKQLPDSPGPEAPDKEGLFQKMPQRDPQRQSSTKPQSGSEYPEFYQQYWPPPGSEASNASEPSTRLHAPTPMGINRLSSTASTATTKAQRGSPPPPETPVVAPGDDIPGGGIEQRFAAAGIAGNSTLTSLQAQNAAAAQRAQQYAAHPPRTQTPQQQPAPRRWTPTEEPGTQPHGPPTVYQGQSQASSPPPMQAPTPQGRTNAGAVPQRITQPSAIEQDMQRLNMTSSPPPAYHTVSGGTPGGGGQSYPNEKQSQVSGGAQNAHPASGLASPGPNQGHPAYANDPHASLSQQNVSQPGPSNITQQSAKVPNIVTTGAGAPPASPPPLPEGWIAHLDPNSGQYYYIHLPTQSTQWEFPKGPTPLNLNEPLSPVGSTFQNPLASPGLSSFSKPLASPGFGPTPATPGYAESVMSMQSTTSMAGFTGPPPSSGVDMYKVAPTNGVYFGPYLRYTNMDIERGIWLGSILLVTDAPHPPTIHIHQSVDLSPNPRQLKANPISVHQRWTFYRYDIDLQMDDEGAKWTYAITSHLGCTRYEFLVAGRHETSWRFIATSGNDFALNVNANERARLGGIGFMWKDIMQKHAECGGFHTQLGVGDQIYGDRIWKEIPLLKQWLVTSGKENRKNAPWTAQHEEEVSHAYFHYYTSHFDQPYLREAFAQIPHVLTIDDHDIFDGFGSYPEYMQFSNMFKNIGRIGIEFYLLFQHHTTLEILRTVSTDTDIFTITGTGWHFIKYLGPAVVVVGPDTRSERNPHQVMAGPTYQGLFPKIAMLPGSVQHCIWMIPVPVIYPRLEAAEQIAQTVATGKKAVTGTYNLLGKVTSSVAGVVGAKGVVGSGFDSVKKAVGKSGLMGGILSPFGDIDMLDELRDLWTHESKDLERTYLLRTLSSIAHTKSLRMTLLSSSPSSVCGAGLIHDPSSPQNHKTIYQLLSSSVVNSPASNMTLKLLHQGVNKPIYIPQNGHRSQPGGPPSDIKEDMMEIFTQEPDARPREMRRLMNRRNYIAIVPYDPEVVQGTFGNTDMHGVKGGGRLSLAVDFMVQGDTAGQYGAQGAASGPGAMVNKYGPVVVPSLEFGR